MTSYQWGLAIKQDLQKTFIETTGLTKTDFMDYCPGNLFFFTMKYERGYEANTSSPQQVLSHFRRWYFYVVKSAFGKVDSRLKNQLQPRTWAFVDFNGSRHGRGGFDMLKSGPAHVHALMMVMPGEGQKFKQVTVEQMIGCAEHITDIDVEVFRIYPLPRWKEWAFHRSLTLVASYCAKGVAKLPYTYADAGDTWDLLPR